MPVYTFEYCGVFFGWKAEYVQGLKLNTLHRLSRPGKGSFLPLSRALCG